MFETYLTKKVLNAGYRGKFKIDYVKYKMCTFKFIYWPHCYPLLYTENLAENYIFKSLRVQKEVTFIFDNAQLIHFIVTIIMKISIIKDLIIFY